MESVEPVPSTESDREVREAIQGYLYTNPLTSFMSNLGHWTVRHVKRLHRRSRPSVTTLDLCCGLGHCAAHAWPWERFTGLDDNPNFIAEAKRQFGEHEFVRANVLAPTWPLGDRRFDFITANQALEHFSNADLGVMFDNVRRRLAAGGRFIYVIPLDDSFAVRLGRRLTSERYMRKRFANLDYRHWLHNREHINDYDNIQREVRSAFVLEREIFLPFGLPVVDANVYCVGVCRTHDDQRSG